MLYFVCYFRSLERSSPHLTRQTCVLAAWVMSRLSEEYCFQLLASLPMAERNRFLAKVSANPLFRGLHNWQRSSSQGADSLRRRPLPRLRKPRCQSKPQPRRMSRRLQVTGSRTLWPLRSTSRRPLQRPSTPAVDVPSGPRRKGRAQAWRSSSHRLGRLPRSAEDTQGSEPPARPPPLVVEEVDDTSAGPTLPSAVY